MSAISLGTGLISGLNTTEIVDALIAVQRNGAARMETQAKVFQGRQAALSALQAALLPLSTSSAQLGLSTTFKAVKVTNSSPSQLSVATSTTASPGDYSFRTIRTAQTDEIVSAGVANADTKTFGTGKIVISSSGSLLRKPTSLNMLNGGDGVRRGSIKVTDRSGASATIDLSTAVDVNDVLKAINDNETLSVTASTEGGKIILTDTSGSTASNLAVTEVNGGHMAQDLGLLGSVASSTLEGSDAYQVSGAFSLKQINDGNGMRLVSGNDLRITLSDNTNLTLDLDNATTLDDVVDKINNHAGNGGKLSAAFTDGRLVLTDLSGGSGPSTFHVEDIGDASVIHELGLDKTASSGAITGGRLFAGMNSVLLSNLRGGRGIDEIGEISLTDRAGNTATIDLSGAESLDEVLSAINGAKTTGDVKLSLTARLNAAGTGIEVVDTSGATASNLIIADVGGSTLADQLGIDVNAAVTSVDSGSLSLRSVNEATSLATYRLNGSSVRAGTFRITNSQGTDAVISINATDKTIGDVIKKINSAGLSVTAKLNDTGDGVALVDEAGGSSALSVVNVTGTAATDLNLAGTGTLNTDNKSQINGRRAVVVDVTADDTLNSIRNKINLVGGFVAASVISTGNTIKPVRLLLRSNQSGAAGQIVVDDGGLDLGFDHRVEGKDAVLQVGQQAGGSTFLTSSSNNFSNVNTGVSVTVIAAGAETANVSLTRDDSQIETTLKTFINSYNAYRQAQKDSTKFDLAAGKKGVLQGDGFTLRLQTKFDSLLNARYAPDTSSIRTLIDVGISVGSDGKLSLDSAKLNKALADNRTEVVDFFQKPTTGFSAKLAATLDSLTNTTNGAFKVQNDSLQTNIDALATRVTAIDKILATRRDRLLIQFSKMEETLNNLQGSQSALAGIQKLSSPSSS